MSAPIPYTEIIAQTFRLPTPESVREVKARRRGRLKEATPPWADKQKIRAIYSLASWLTTLTGVEHHVDHAVPLFGDEVCGLHVETSLQVMSPAMNLQKGNRRNK